MSVVYGYSSSHILGGGATGSDRMRNREWPEVTVSSGARTRNRKLGFIALLFFILFFFIFLFRIHFFVFFFFFFSVFFFLYQFYYF
jgi:hypothetical protein